MDKIDIVVKVAMEDQSEFLSLLRSESGEDDIVLRRVSTWRSPEITLTDVLLTLVSAGSLTALATIVKAYLDRTRGKIEIISEKNGLKAIFDGPLDQLPLAQLRDLLESPALSESASNSKDELTPLQGNDTIADSTVITQDNSQVALSTKENMTTNSNHSNSADNQVSEQVEPELVEKEKQNVPTEIGSEGEESSKAHLPKEALQDDTNSERRSESTS